MCGFLYINDKLNEIDLKKSYKALNLQLHRGPDFQGEIGYINAQNKNDFVNVKNNKNLSVNQYFGHNRLKIIDLNEKSNQPVIKNKSFFLYNGEFYNFQKFDFENTQSDTLTLFNGLEKNGLDFLNQVNGMWSFVYGDLNKNKIFLSRDRYGKKPLYYYKNSHLFIASSEIKSIFRYLDFKSREINPSYLASFFSTKLFDNSSSATFYKEIQSVKPGEVLEIDNSNFNIRKILNVKKFPLVNFELKSRDEIKKNLEIDLQNAVSSRLISDVPVGVLLSGGIDSTAILSNIIKLKKDENVNFFYAKQFVTNKNKISEDDQYVKILAKNLKFKLNEIDLLYEKSSIENIFKILCKQFEEPFNIELSSVSTYLISKQMQHKGIKVSIDGVGGDEVMNGYPTYQSLANANLIKNNFSEFVKFSKLHMDSSENNKFVDFLLIASQIKNKFFYKKKIKLNRVYSNKFNEFLKKINLIKLRAQYSTVIKRQLFELFKFQIPYYLKTSDQCNMINSVENRSPFLDYNLFKYVFLKDEFKFNSNFTKILIRETLIDTIPDEVVFRKKKGGFGSSIDINSLKTKKNLEMILDCKIARSILSKNINSEEILNEKALFKNLLILSFLSNEYSLTLNL